MKSTSFLVRLFWLLMLVFLIGRIGFMSYNAELWPSAADPSVTGFSGSLWLKDLLLTCFYGAASHDIFVVGALVALPALCELCGMKRLRLWLTPYYIIMGIVVSVIIVADAVMYEFWQFKLSNVVLAYAAYPEGTANSVSLGFVASRLGAGLALMALTIGGCIWCTPRRRSESTGSMKQKLPVAIIAVIAFFGLFSQEGIGSVYKSDRIFLNHAAVNPVYGFVSSVPFSDYGNRYDYLSGEECCRFAAALDYDNGTNEKAAFPDTANVLLRTQRPDVLIVFAESFGSEFVTSLGAPKGTTPDGRSEDIDQQLERLIPEGIFWTNYYSNSFRTDRGTVSAFCGWPAYTDVGLMTHSELHAYLPSLPKSMQRGGYDTFYLYPGAMTNMGKGTFLANIGFEHLLDDKAFSAKELDTAWGASDMVSARKVASIMSKPAAKPRLFVYQTVSSHEPWDVPYDRLTDKVQNAFAYTDAAIGQLVDSLKASPAWDNLLVIIIPDHGHLYKVHAPGDPNGPLHRQAFDDPEFFHSPMLWLGGAIKAPGRKDVLMNQSDLCATLLGQLRLDHSDYRWSCDVLSPDYRHPFVYSVFPAGLLFRDATGTTIYDVTADRTLYTSSPDNRQREQKAKAILQRTYDELQVMTESEHL